LIFGAKILIYLSLPAQFYPPMNRLTELQQFLKEDPEDAFVKYALSLEYLRLNNLPEAGKIFSQLAENNPPYLPVFYQYGKFLEQTGDPGKAKMIYTKGMEIASSQRNQKTWMELKEALSQMEGEAEE